MCYGQDIKTLFITLYGGECKNNKRKIKKPLSLLPSVFCTDGRNSWKNKQKLKISKK